MISSCTRALRLHGGRNCRIQLILCGVPSCCRSNPPLLPSLRHWIHACRIYACLRGQEDSNARIEWSNGITGGRERAKQIDIRKHAAHGAIQGGRLRPLIRVASAACHHTAARGYLRQESSRRSVGSIRVDSPSRRHVGTYARSLRDADPSLRARARHQLEPRVSESLGPTRRPGSARLGLGA